ncbi:MAG: HNH nuclease family protein [Deltaproteobacteria bacterium]|nr:HNH nuclease family protein [Deltaproteobacteria bacterium]
MRPKKPASGQDKAEEFMAQARREQQGRMQGYRERALKLFPAVCARCGREFEGKKLAQLTVHHKDHNHDNNPPDGSNWELLCLYCHENEHSRSFHEDWYDVTTAGEEEQKPSTTFKPFAGLEGLLKDKKE